MPTVCLIGPGHVASNPRLVKEADALHAAGYRVRVVSGTSHPLIDPLDLELLASRPWRATRMRLGPRWHRLPGTLRQKAAARRVELGRDAGGDAARDGSPLLGRLAAAAAAEPADLYVGHYLPGLFAAREAARKHETRWGFDAEDDHVEELPRSSEFAPKRAARERFERHALAGCRHLTASSPMIAENYRRRYGVETATVLNVFPSVEAPSTPAEPARQGRGGPTLYWFSQTVGSGRGLEQVVAAMGRMRTPAVLHLRGIPAARYRESLERLAAELGVAGRVVWHPPAAPGEMVRLAASHDLGLALELCEPPNRAVCLTNKAFTYLLAGVPVVLSRTPAQEWLAGQVGDAGLLVDLGDPVALAARLDSILGDSTTLRRTREAAWRLGRERFNWDVEQHVFLQSVRQALA